MCYLKFNNMRVRKHYLFSVLMGLLFILILKITLILKKVDTHDRIERIPGFRERVRETDCDASLRGRIPKRIHQVWNDEIVPEEFLDHIRSLVRDNPPPEWEYIFWTKESGLQFIEDVFPNILPIVNAKDSSNVLRADILRYLVLYEYGGAYFDIDTMSVRPLDSFVENHECSFVQEPAEHYFYMKTDFMLTNSALLCVPRHPFYKHILFRIFTMDKKCKDPFFCTGPPVISAMYREINRTTCDVGRLPDVQSSEVFQDKYDHKLQKENLDRVCAPTNYENLVPYEIQICEKWKRRGRENRKLSKKAYTYHTWFHTTNHNVTIVAKNRISNIVPTVKIYGKNFRKIDLI